MSSDPTKSSDLRILRLLVGSVPGVAWAVDPDLTTIFVSEGADRHYGRPASHFLGHGTERFREIVHPDDLDRFDSTLVVQHEGPSERELRVVHPDGEVRWLLTRSSPVFADDGALEMVVGTSIDVTAQKRAERRFRNLVEELPLAMYLGHRAPEIPLVYVNRQIEDLTGYTPEEWLVDLPFWRILDPRDTAVVVGVTDHLLHSDEPIRATFRLRRKDGRTIWVQEHSVAVADETGELTLVQGFQLDVTEIVKVTEELRESEERSRAFIETAWDAFVTTHVDGTVSDVRGTFGNLIGRPRDEMVGMSIFDLAAPYDHPRLVERMHTDDTSIIEVDVVHADGSIVPVEVVSRNTEIGRVAARQLGIRDITQRRRAEVALAEAESRALHAQKLEAVGRLAGGIAHDFNNLLMAISGYADVIIGGLPEESPYRVDAEEIRGTATRGAELTRQLLAFSRRQVIERQPLSLSAVVTDAVGLLQRLVGENVRIVTRLETNIGAVLADRGELEQILANLVVNAKDAMPDGGEVVIETRSELVAPDADGPMHPGSYAVLAVTDSGAGMDPETEAQIFEPYFTTKEQSKGTGLGLASVYGIVSQFEGVIVVRTAPDQGTTFTISFPVTSEALPSYDVTTPPSPVHQLGAGERVLLVEDQENVRRILAKLVEDLGYSVDVAGGGEAALGLIERETDYALLVTDVLMPNMDGPELVERARKLRPELPVLYVSGYTTDELLEPGGLPPRTAFLTKPFTRATLAAEIGAVMGAASA
jgi:two-component system, cell cycle sensor histidine kinase and response regulator CckA